jgi:Zn finger protein HypA/HybF involved in hydrogenase expression
MDPINFLKSIKSYLKSFTFKVLKSETVIKEVPIVPIKYKQKQFVCKKCNKIYKTYNGRYLHIRAVHDEIRYQCNLCSQEFMYKSSRNKHQKYKRCKPNMFSSVYF